MNNRKKMATVSYAEILVGVVWCITMLLFIDYENAGILVWESLAFGMVAFIVAGIAIWKFGKKIIAEAEEVSYVPVVCSWIYLVFMAIFNGVVIVSLYYSNGEVLVWNRFEFDIRISLALNLLITLIYAIYIIVSGKYNETVQDNLERSLERTQLSKIVSMKMGAALNKCRGSEYEEKIRKIKESVDYSSNVSSDSAKYIEENMVLKLDEFIGLLSINADKEVILSKIEEIENVWNERNRN